MTPRSTYLIALIMVLGLSLAHYLPISARLSLTLLLTPVGQLIFSLIHNTQ